METTIISVDDITPEIYSVKLKKPKNFSFEPGQFIMIRQEIKKDMTIRTIKRSYSIASSPDQDFLELIIKKVPNGNMTTFLYKSKPGTTLEILGPYGKFKYSGEQNVSLIAAGAGIAPLLSIIRSVEKEMVLVYSSRTKDEIVYADELDSYNNLNVIHTLTREKPVGWTGETGRIQKGLLEQVINPNSTVFICGPPNFVKIVKLMLKELNVQDIKFEAW